MPCRSQFYQGYKRTFFGAKTSNPKHSFVIFGTKILYKKCARKTLMKLTPVSKDQVIQQFLNYPIKVPKESNYFFFVLTNIFLRF